MTLLGGLALYALECIGAVIAVVGVLVIAFYSIVIAVIAMLYAIVWGVAISCAALDRSNPPKRMQPRCPKCDSAKWLGKPGEKVCTNCGAQEQWL